MLTEAVAGDARRPRQAARQAQIAEAVMADGTIRIERLAKMFDISLMTVHRDLDHLEARGVLRKSRGVATATSTILVESSDVYRLSHQAREKEALALAAMDLVEPGQAILLDDSTTVLRMAPHLESKAPLTVVTNVLTLMSELRGKLGLTLIGIGGQFYGWCNAFMGPMTTRALADIHGDTAFLSTSAITRDIAFHQFTETIDTKRAMLRSANQRVLLVDHTKFERQALHALAPLTEFDTVIVDNATPGSDVTRMQEQGIHVVVAPQNAPARRESASHRVQPAGRS